MPTALLPYLVSVHCTRCIAVKDLGECDSARLPPVRPPHGSACCDACGERFDFEAARLYVRPRPMMN
jgi:hypothetical protein